MSVPSYFCAMSVRHLRRLILMLSILMTSCSQVTKLDSDAFEEVEQRIRILKQEIHPFSEFHDAEFKLFNVNGFKGQRQGFTVPGGSSFDYKFVIRADTADLRKWTESMVVKSDTAQIDPTWTKELTTRRSTNWRTTCKPTYYIRENEGVTVIAFQNDGILFKRVILN